ncbi:unnamed protein product [Paramecium sonneborni]|uniref:Uncharacterized protein n=1 Tax=Paramecium sonneborni TaxID=65129 RepID=A0A8S1RSQ8_9CILI|nr:unnamed protein product [Paramecium sonneborni]
MEQILGYLVGNKVVKISYTRFNMIFENLFRIVYLQFLLTRCLEIPKNCVFGYVAYLIMKLAKNNNLDVFLMERDVQKFKNIDALIKIKKVKQCQLQKSEMNYQYFQQTIKCVKKIQMSALQLMNNMVVQSQRSHNVMRVYQNLKTVFGIIKINYVLKRCVKSAIFIRL